MRPKLTVDVLVRSWLECCRRGFGGEERIFCSRRDRARLRSMAKISFDLVLSDNVRAMIYGREEEIDGQVRTRYAFMYNVTLKIFRIRVRSASFLPRKSESWIAG